MATGPGTPSSPARPPLRRDPGRRLLGGVCSGLARLLGVDPLLVRVAFIAAALAGGLGFVLYALGWVAMPADERAASDEQEGVGAGRGSVEVALGVGFLLLSVLLGFRELGLWFSDAVVWPVVLVASGGALLWRQSSAGAREAAQARHGATWPVGGRPAPAEGGVAPTADEVRKRAAIVSRTSLGVALVIAAGLVFLQATGALSAARDVVLAALVVAVVLGVIFAPWIVRLARSLSTERAERIRSQERAEVAAHLHDSVLQTLALVQQQAGDPRRVSALARQQERELRSWLSGKPRAGGAPGRLAAALEDAAEEVERDHGVAVEVVVVGDCGLDEDRGALVAAAREAMVNAAKFGEGSPVAVYAEASEERVHAYVRDRGPGFDPAAVAEDRRGVRESIVGRMERHGGRASIASSPGTGTEVELLLEEDGP